MIVKGQRINDRYEVRKLIGEGGMANVYLGYDTILERDVAIKVLRGDLADDEKFVRRFRREAQSASLLSHPKNYSSTVSSVSSTSVSTSSDSAACAISISLN